MNDERPRNTRRVFCLLSILLLAASLCPSLKPRSRAQTSQTSFAPLASQESVALFAAAQTEGRQFVTVAPGVEHLQFTRGHASPDETTGPWSINVLQLDLSRTRLQVVHAMDEGVGLETVSSIVARYRAVAAINGGYFRTTGTFRGESVGTLLLHGKLLSEPNNDRAAMGLITGSGTTQAVFGHLKFGAEISLGNSRGRTGLPRGQPARGEIQHAVAGINRPLSKDELIVFTPQFHRTTLTTPEGAEAVVEQGRVLAVRDLHGSSEIPSRGYVVSGVGSSREWLLRNLRRGTRVSFSWRLTPIDTAQEGLWRRSDTVIGGGPQLVKDGKVAITNSQEKIAPAFVSDRHPRTAIAKLVSGKLLFITVDGRQPKVSVGMSLDMLANLLLEFGALDAINLDGGGSTTMVVRGKVVNRPSDQTGERPVSDAILVFAR